MTPFLINTGIKDFDQYIKSLSPNARKHYKKAVNRNKDIEYACVDFDPVVAGNFMKLWERQIVEGRHIKWTFGLPYLKYLAGKNKLLCFTAQIKNTYDIICLQFAEYYDNYVIGVAPLYDKDQYLERTIAKYMWFQLINYSITHPGIKWVDLGAHGSRTWRELVFLYKKGTLNSYKWQFVPAYIKENPGLAEPYITRNSIFQCKIYLGEKKNKAYEMLYTVKRLIARFLYIHRGQRVNKIIDILSKMINFY